jgi:hypothetical protein
LNYSLRLQCKAPWWTDFLVLLEERHWQVRLTQQEQEMQLLLLAHFHLPDQ